MFNETVINLCKEDYIEYLICECKYSAKEAEHLADILYE